MYIVAGPPGSGKSTFFSRDFFEGTDYFNADDRAAHITGSYLAIPKAVRSPVNQEFEQFVHFHIAGGSSFALETTLRSEITFEQMRLARAKGFRVHLRYIGVSEDETGYLGSDAESLAAISGCLTKPELRLRGALHTLGFRYRLRDKSLQRLR